MKYFSLILAAIFILLNFISCEEIGPNINLTSDSNCVTYIAEDLQTAQVKVVLLEEFTGVRCVNCPDGHALAKSLKSAHGNRFVSISYNSDFLDEPYSFSLQDLGSDDAQAIEEFLASGEVPKPQATIDRFQFPGESKILYFTSKWTTFTQDRLDDIQMAPVNISIAKSFDPDIRKLNVDVTVHYTQSIPTANNLSVFLIESDIITAQLGQAGVDANYVHKDVLRIALSDVKGDALEGNLEPKREFVCSYELSDMNFLWVEDNMEIVAFVHTSASSKEVLQTAITDLID